MLYIKECAELVGLEVIEGETAFSIIFMAEIMRRLREMISVEVIDEIEDEINSSNRGTCDYFIVDRIEEIIDKYRKDKNDTDG